MNNIIANLSPERIFLGVPQTDKIQVYAVAQGKGAVVTQGILSNTTEYESKLTITVNTIDVMQNVTVGVGETKILDLYIVLNQGDTVSLKQDTENAINVTLNGYVG